MSGAMGSHQSARAMTTTWLTPPEILEAVGPFDLDPCAAPSPRPWATAARHIELPEDGLAAEWTGRVWLNPPYSMEAWMWLSKLADHGDGIALVFARTETAGFVRTVWKRATAVLFLHGRLYFHKADGTRAAANSGAPSVLVAYGDAAAERLRTSGLDGTFLALVSPVSEQPTPEVAISINGRTTIIGGEQPTTEPQRCLDGHPAFVEGCSECPYTFEQPTPTKLTFNRPDLDDLALDEMGKQPTPLDPEPVVYVRRDGSLSPNRSAVLGLIDAFPDMYRFKPRPEFEQDRARYEQGGE